MARRRKTKVINIILVSAILILVSILGPPVAAIIEVELVELTTRAYQDKWEEDKKVEFTSQGINVSIVNYFTYLEIKLIEQMSRDVRVRLRIPRAIMKPSAIGLIQTKDEEDDTEITWNAQTNHSTIIVTLYPTQTVVFTISKTDLFFGKLKKKMHNIGGYAEFNAKASELDDNVAVYINKKDIDFELDNNHIIVQRKTTFHEWYYPVDPVISADTYWYMDDLDDKYRVVTRFKTSDSADIKIFVFPGASEGIFNWDAFRGRVARSWLSLQIGLKKAIMDWVSD